jgi:hypothetical protein
MPPLASCGGGCVQLQTDPMNCGSCGRACAANDLCSAGACVPAGCPAGFADCDATGDCETNVVSDTRHCGSCGNACSMANGNPLCMAGQCGIICWNGYANCDLNAANGCETSLGEVANCGACGRPCYAPHATVQCACGTCTIVACLPGRRDADGSVLNGCEANCLPSGAETCNGVDDDCDGVADDGLAAQECEIPGLPGLVYQDTSPQSQCRKGTRPCAGACTGFTCPTTEICNGLDDDCDGLIDEEC